MKRCANWQFNINNDDDLVCILKAVNSKSKKMELFQDSVRSVQGDNPKTWLTLDKAKLMGTFDSTPSRDEIEEPVEEQLVVELYSK